ncbi:pirin family protein [Nitrososphaera sp.]|uniref:pirin family protein n=1 Tax=Nitrososphaera sp. TaxID=1971748 RepID=UPI00179E4024|nr:pirin family protein [Nitrososphaera sp.]NWG37047.1 pirin family protein [Nitrososphaera sp.]
MERSIKNIANGKETLEGEGVIVRRAFPNGALREIDPFLLLDEMGPKDFAPGELGGFPDHPHRGFETVTYLLEGQFEHRDSRGHAGRLAPGDVQWMTAGSGVVHSEMPAKDFAKTGGRLHGFQLWVNLPRRDKMMQPRYQEIPASEIPVAEGGNAKIRVIAGESLGKKAVIDTRIPIMYLHVTLKQGTKFEQKVPADYNAFAYVVDGSGTFGGKKAGRGQVVIFNRDGDSVSVAAETDLSVLLIGGAPLNEPVVRYGPFVMNTAEEIQQAIEDYSQGRMGIIAR